MTKNKAVIKCRVKEFLLAAERSNKSSVAQSVRTLLTS